MNYVRLARLLPAGRTSFCYAIAPASSQICDSLLSVTTVQKTPYTSLLNLVYLIDEAQESDFFLLQVRSYHDARMTEVVSCQKQRNFQLYYQYPNPQMYHSDEKRQLNELLAQWLRGCAEHGRSVDGFDAGRFANVRP